MKVTQVLEDQDRRVHKARVVLGEKTLSLVVQLAGTEPADRLDNGGPGCNFVRRIWVGFHRLLQVLTRKRWAQVQNTSQYVK
jgi:hypothetical protein